MDEELRVLARLERIETLEREGAPPGALLGEVRDLLAEAEAWVATRPPGADRAAAALERCDDALTRGAEVAMA